MKFLVFNREKNKFDDILKDPSLKSKYKTKIEYSENLILGFPEDDDFGKYQARFKNDPFSAMNNPSGDTSTYFNKRNNVIMGNDGSTITYFVPSNKL